MSYRERGRKLIMVWMKPKWELTEMATESQCIKYCEKCNIFPHPPLHPVEKNPGEQATWWSAEGSHPAAYQAIIQNSNSCIHYKARIFTQVKYNTTELQQRENLDAIWFNTKQIMISHLLKDFLGDDQGSEISFLPCALKPSVNKPKLTRSRLQKRSHCSALCIQRGTALLREPGEDALQLCHPLPKLSCFTL